MRAHGLVLVLLLAAGRPAHLAAQGPAVVNADSVAANLVFTAADAQPGAIVSAVLRVPLPSTTEPAQFQIRVAAGVLLHGTASGELRATDGSALLPVAFSVARDAAAGTTRVARVVVVHADGSEWIADVQSRVTIRRGLALALDSSAVLVARGDRVRIGYTLRNTGNATDTIAFRLQAPAHWPQATPSGVVLAPGAAHTGTLDLAASPDAPVGETQILRLTATGRGSTAAANLSFEVGSGLSRDSRWVQLPATLLVGASDAGAGTATPLALALDARGRIGQDTDASLLVRRAPRDDTPPAFLPYLAGPSLRAELRRGPHRVSAGDLLFGGSALQGGFLQASGVDARVQLGSVTTSVFAGQPFQLDEPGRPGHLVRAGAEAELAAGTIGVVVADLDRPAGLSARSERTRMATASWQGELLQGLSTRAEAGLVHLRDADGRTRDGVALEVESRFRRDRFGIEARVRRVPGTLATAGRASDETYVASSLDLGAGLSLQGWAIRNEIRLLDGTGSTQDGAAAGARWQRGAASARVGVNVSETSGEGLLTGDARRRSLSVGATAPVGPLLLEGSLDVGTMQVRDVENDLRQAMGRVSWNTRSGMAWIGATHAGGMFGSDLTRVDAGANARRGRLEVDARAGRYLGAGTAGRFDAWLATTVHVDRSTAVVAGLDHTPWTGGGVRVSLGVRRALAMPLPLQRQPAVDGVLFEDRNGNLERDAGEPPLAGVRVRLDGMLAVTDEHGRFAFYDASHRSAELRIDVGSLDAGLMLPPGSAIPAQRRVAVPVHRAAALRLDLFLDENGDGMRGAGEQPAAGGAIQLVDGHGRTRVASADADGTLRFGALSPGTYTVRASPSGSVRAPEARTLEIGLAAGAAARLDVPVPFRAREIRFGPTGTPPADSMAGDPPHAAGLDASGGAVPAAPRPASGAARATSRPREAQSIAAQRDARAPVTVSATLVGAAPERAGASVVRPSHAARDDRGSTALALSWLLFLILLVLLRRRRRA